MTSLRQRILFGRSWVWNFQQFDRSLVVLNWLRDSDTNLLVIPSLAGIIAGAVTSLAMASAAFAQAKQGFQGKASLAAAYTGISYFVNAVILATPYFLTRNMLAAITTSVSLGVVIIAFIQLVQLGNVLKSFQERFRRTRRDYAWSYLSALCLRHTCSSSFRHHSVRKRIPAIISQDLNSREYPKIQMMTSITS